MVICEKNYEEYGDDVINYEFKAKDIQGKTKTGIIKAENINEFYSKLREQNLLCISVNEAVASSSMTINIGSQRTGGKKLKLKDLVVFCRQFATMMNAGVTVVKCLDILYRQAENKRFKNSMLELYESIKVGNSLSFAMREQGKAFPNLLISMIESGEASGKLDDVMLTMADHFEKEKKLKGKIKVAMVYPIILIITIIAVVIILLTKVMPTIFGLFNSTENLPKSTRILISISNSLTHYWYIHIIVIAAIVILFFILNQMESFKLGLSKLKLKFPIFGKLMKIVYTARFSGTVAALYTSGVPIIEAIQIASNVLGNKFISQKLDNVVVDIKQGLTFSQAITNANVFPPMFSSMTVIGEESGSLDDILQKTSDYYDDEAQTAIAKMVALMEPLMIIIMALIVGFIVVSIAQPMFGMYDYIT